MTTWYIDRVRAESEFTISGTMTTYFHDPELLAQIIAEHDAKQEFAKAISPPPTLTAVARFMGVDG